MKLSALPIIVLLSVVSGSAVGFVPAAAPSKTTSCAFRPTKSVFISEESTICTPATGTSTTSLQYSNAVSPETRQFTKQLKSILGNKRRQRTSAQEAEEYLFQTLTEGTVRPDVVAFTKVISAWARSRRPDAPDRAEALLSRMIDIANDEGREDVRPNTFTYNALINAFARRGLVAKAEEYLSKMQEVSTNVDADCITYNSVINAYASSRKAKKEGGQRALELFEEMKSDESIKPDSVTYGSVIKCLTNAGGKANAEKAEELLNELEELYENSDGADESLAPNTIIYNSVLNAWSTVRGGIGRAEAILDRMEELHGAGNGDVSPDAFTFSSLIKAWTAAASSGKGRRKAAGSGGGVDDTDDDTDLLGRSAAERAQQLLDRMEQLYRNGDDDVKPNKVVYNSVIHAWARSGEAGSAQRAEDLLARMQQQAKVGDGDDDVKPDVVTFNSVIDAWARAEEYGSAEKAENLLSSMEKQYIAGDESVKPDIKSINSCINAWSRTGGPGAGLRAEQLLDRAESLYEETGDDDVRPNKVTYSSVINAHAKSYKKGCGEFAEAILDHMEEMYEDGASEARPNPIAFSAVLQAWQNSDVGLSAPRAEGLLMRMMEYLDEGKRGGKDVIDANKTFDLVVRLLDKTYDEDTIGRIEELREGIRME